MTRGAEMMPTEERSGLRLPQVFSLGFLGSAPVAEETPCKSAILKLLQEEKAVPHRRVYAVVMIANHTDLLCAECCLELAIPLQVMLAEQREVLRASFEVPARARFERVLHDALDVEIVGEDGSTAERAYECGVALVQQSELVIALCDGELPSFIEETLVFARSMRRPIVQILAGTGVVERAEGGWAHHRDAELEFLNLLDDAGVQAKDDAPRSVAQAWQAKLSANAGKVAPRVRRLAAVPILCTALAAVISGAAPRLQMKLLWTGLGVILGIIAALLPTALQLAKRQVLWVRLRTATEVTRSIRALWDTPLRYDLVGPEILPELSGMVRSLNLLKAAGRTTLVGEVEAFKQRYCEERVQDQMRYFSAQARQAAARGSRYRRLSKLCIAAAVLISAAMFAGHLTLQWNEGAWVGLLTSALFQGATIAGALIVVHDCDRRERRYQELHNSLSALNKELVAFRTWPLVNRTANKIERTLLVELIEWRSLLQNRKMPRN